MRMSAPLGDSVELRRVYGCFPSGVTSICAVGADGRPIGMAMSSFTSVSLEPPLVSVCVQNTSATWPLLRGVSRLGASVLAEGQGDAARSLAARDGDRFAGVEWKATGGGAVLLCGAAAWLECEVEAELAVGDHLLVFLRVLSLSGDPDRPPLVFHSSRFCHLTASRTEFRG